MFGRNRKEFREFKEQTTCQLAVLDQKVQLLINSDTKDASMVNDTEPIDMDPLKAAYALNLCTISVSQIIDYNDLNVLEQEYDAILNNINIEHMPNDESLLHILRQILDTITFFRIQEGDREIAELEYQHKIKNEIWSAVPNLGVIIATANPIAMAVSLASQVGVGYMNYRNQKAQNRLEKQKADWQLQRSAMEQFNVLRRELFDTAWRISKKYGFPDEYRLTEKQIHHYNSVLMEPDIFKKEILMDAMKDDFIAYPPFWYYWGHNAYLIAQTFGAQREQEYLQNAKERFDHFDKCNVFPLLRTDLLAASCYLEYCGLLDPQEDREKIIDLTKRALKVSGNANDVKQLCAYEYLRIKELELAKPILLSLVVNDFNSISNAQILSHIYSFQAWRGIDIAREEHETLSRFISNELLCQIPSEGESFTVASSNFLASQKVQVERNAKIVLDNLVDKYARHLNRLIQTPSADGNYSDEYFSDKPQYKKTRYSEIVAAQLWKQGTPSLDINHIQTEYCHSLTEYINRLNNIVDDDDMVALLNTDTQSLLRIIESYSTDTPITDFFDTIQVCRTVESCNERFIEVFRKQINSCETIDQLFKVEDKLRELCNEEDLMNYDSLYSKPMASGIPGKPKIILGATKGYEKDLKRKECRKKMKDICLKYADRIATGHSAKLYVQGTPDYDRYLRDYKSSIDMIDNDTSLLWDNGAIAFIHLGGTYINTIINCRTDSDIILTDDELIKLNFNIPNFHAKYEKIKCEDRILYSDYKIKPLAVNMYVDVNSLYDLIQELLLCRRKYKD